MLQSIQHHAWDFMSLLKVLQRELTCVDLPWMPKGNPEVRHLINEIVLGEESDMDENGNYTSHFELYLKAMKQTQANSGVISNFINSLGDRISLQASFSHAKVPLDARYFVENTFSIINSNKVYVQAATFTFGREDLIPGMFLKFVTELNKQKPNAVTTLKYYLERHIEIDGEHHSKLACKMTELLCGNDEYKWSEATAQVIKALHARIRLWDAIVTRIE